MAAMRSHIRSHANWVALLDVACLVAGSAVGLVLRIGHEEMGEYVFHHVDGWLIFFGSVMLANYLAGAYKLQHAYSRFNLVVTWGFSLAFALIMLSITSYAWFRVLLGRGVLGLSVATYSILSLALKLVVYRDLFRSPFFQCRTAIIGVGEQAREVRRTLERDFVLPVHRVVAFVKPVAEETPSAATESMDDGVAVIDTTIDDLESVIRGLGVTLVIIALEKEDEFTRLYPTLRRLRFSGTEILTPLAVEELYNGRTPLALIDEEHLTQASMESELPLVRHSKRVLDLVLAMVGSLVFLPVGILVAFIIKLGAPRSPVFYSQVRAGQFGRPFRILKFRTMKEGVEQDSGAVWASRSDPRITLIGRFLRRFRMDEIPQVVNILKGDMSVVGPRPERPEIIEQLGDEIPFYAERENVIPGLTGWAQVRYPYGGSVEDTARKLEYDLYYMKHLSLSLDLQIILSTLRIVIFGMEHVRRE
ncbi:MAG: sugar transferase [Lentisphaerae bacterium]|nr:sugar transferase [Lentisphaerota bacterium]